VSLSGAGGVVRLPADSGPAWLLEIDDGSTVEQHAVSLVAGSEWQPAPGSDELLRALAERTDGRVLTLDDDPASVFDVDSAGRGRQEAVSVWWVPALLALVLFLVDIGVRLGVSLRRRT